MPVNYAFDACVFVWLLRKSRKMKKKKNAGFLIYLVFHFRKFTLSIFKIYLITFNTKIHMSQFNWINKTHRQLGVAFNRHSSKKNE